MGQIGNIILYHDVMFHMQILNLNVPKQINEQFNETK